MSQLPARPSRRPPVWERDRGAGRPSDRDENKGQVRAFFQTPPEWDEAASVWVKFAPKDGGATLTLLYDYPDFRPQAGWRVEAGGKTYEIKAVNGRDLDCAEAEGGGE